MKHGPFLGDFLTCFFGLEGSDILKYANKGEWKSRMESPSFVEQWYKNFFGYYRYHLVHETQSIAYLTKQSTSLIHFYNTYCFPTINPLTWVKGSQGYYISVHPTEDIFYLSVTKDPSKFQPHPNDKIVHKFSVPMSRFIAEANIMRAKFLQCISYEKVQQTHDAPKKNIPIPSYLADILKEEPKEKEEKDIKMPRNNNTVHNYSKLIEACIIPGTNCVMEFTFHPVISNLMTSVTPLESEFTFRKINSLSYDEKELELADQKNKSFDKKMHYFKNPWNLTYLIRSNVIPHHVILEFVDKAVLQWESPYRLLSSQLHGQSELSLRALNCVTYTNLACTPLKSEVWMDKYEYLIQSKLNDKQKETIQLTEPVSSWYCSPFDWTLFVLSDTKQQSIPYCTDVLYNGGLSDHGFDTFDILLKEFIQKHVIAQITQPGKNPTVSITTKKHFNPVSRVYRWLEPLFGEDSDKKEMFLSDAKKYLINGPFYQFIKNAPENMVDSSYSIFWCFIYSIVYLNVRTEHLRTHVAKNTQTLMNRINDLKHMSWFTTMNGDTEDFLSTENSFLFGLDVNLHLYVQRAILYNCHLYLTCFLPLASWFKNRILSKKPIKDEHVPIDFLFPWPERSLSWLETPDTRRNLQFVNFWHGNVTVHEDAITTQFQKSLPFRSQGRSIDRKVRHSCYENPSVSGFFFFLIRNTLMGTYSDVFLPVCFKEEDDDMVNMFTTYRHIPLNYRPSFGTMLCLYDAFFHPAILGKMERREEIMHTLLAWGTADSKMSSTLIKDLLISMMMLQPQYIKTQTTFEWKTVWFRNSVVSNIIRFLIDMKLSHLYEQGVKHYSVVDLLPQLPKNIQNSLFSNPSCFAKQTAKYPISAKLYLQFKSYNEQLIIDNVKLREEILVNENHLRDPLLNSPALREWKHELIKSIEKKKEALKVAQFELSDQKKKEIWMAMANFHVNNSTGEELTPQKLQLNGVLNFLTQQETTALFIILNHYIKNVSPKQIENIMPNFSVVGFKTMYFVLKVIKMLESIQTFDIDEASANNVEMAMRHKYNLIPSRPLPEKAYHIYYAYCCKRICNINETKRNFGNYYLLYNPYTQKYLCTKKKIKKIPIFNLNVLVGNIQLKTATAKAATRLQECEELKQQKTSIDSMDVDEDQVVEIRNVSNEFFSPCQQAIDDLLQTTLHTMTVERDSPWTAVEGIFNHLIPKAQKKVARAIERQSNLDCLKNPEVLMINLKGKGIIDKKNHDKPKKYVHCHRCAQLHCYNDGYWYGTQYYCAHCWAERDLFVLECLHCQNKKIKKIDKLCTVKQGSHHNYGIGDEILKREKEREQKVTKKKKKLPPPKMPTIKDEEEPKKEKEKEVAPSSVPYHFSQDIELMFDNVIDLESYEKTEKKVIGTSHGLRHASFSFTAYNREVMNNLYQNEMAEFNLLQPGNEEWEQKYKQKSSGAGQTFMPDQKSKKLDVPEAKSKHGKRKKNNKLPVSGNKNTGKNQNAKLEESQSSYIIREVVMSNRTEKKKLMERAQRSIAKYGRFLFLLNIDKRKIFDGSPICTNVTVPIIWLSAGFAVNASNVSSSKKEIITENNTNPYAGHDISVGLGAMCDVHMELWSVRWHKSQYHFNHPRDQYATKPQGEFQHLIFQKDITKILKRPELFKSKKI